MSDLKPLLGAVLYSWFPDVEHPHRPGPKYRPSIVIDIDPVARKVCLAYGTSQRVDLNYKGEITIRKDDMERLTKDTKFCLARRCWVPATPEYFSADKRKGFELIGKLPDDYIDEFYDRLMEVADS